MNPIYSILSDRKIIVPAQRDADSLYSDGYGSRDKSNILFLEPFEVLYLTEQGKIAVMDETSHEKRVFQELLHKFNTEDPTILTKYFVYKDLRKRGFVARKGLGNGIDFFLWERGEYKKKPPSYLVYVISEGSPKSIERLEKILEHSNEEYKTLKLAVLDRHGEIVYYTLNRKEFENI